MIVAFVVISALVFNVFVPLPAIANVWIRTIGGLVIGMGVALDLWAILTMRRAHTNILPHRAADFLVTSGPFAFTRNPIYVGNTLSMLGAGFCFENTWFVLFGIVGAFMVDRLAIRREEIHLAASFGARWTEYSSRVPRWFIR
jgi:protein-S-isoprenylcysteine O-methyltransferase Ste14